MALSLSPWTKFDSLTTIFWVYNFNSFDMIKFAKHQCDNSHIQNQKVNWFSLQFQIYNKKYWKVWRNMSIWCWVPWIGLIVFILSQWPQHSTLLLVLFMVKLEVQPKTKIQKFQFWIYRWIGSYVLGFCEYGWIGWYLIFNVENKMGNSDKASHISKLT